MSIQMSGIAVVLDCLLRNDMNQAWGSGQPFGPGDILEGLMQRYTVGNAFSEAMAFVKENLTNLLLLLGSAVVLGQVGQVLLTGGSDEQLGEDIAQMIQSGDMQGTVALFGAAFFALMLGAILQSAAQFAILRQGLSDEKDVATTMVYGLIATIVNLLFWMAVGMVVALIFFVLFSITGVVDSIQSGAAPSGAGIAGFVGLFFVMILVVLPLMLWLAARLFVATPLMAHARSINPIYGLVGSWRLTSGSVQWPVLGTLLLFILVVFAISIVFGLVGALFILIGGQVVGAVIAGVVTGVPMAIISLGMTAGVYRALIPTDTRYDIFN